MSQNAADSESPLTCSPECPQEEYVYDYQYAGSAGENISLSWRESHMTGRIVTGVRNIKVGRHLHHQRDTAHSPLLLWKSSLSSEMQLRVQTSASRSFEKFEYCPDLVLIDKIVISTPYLSGHDNDQIEEDVVVVDDAVERVLAPVENLPDYQEENNVISDYTDYTDYEEEQSNTVSDYAEYQDEQSNTFSDYADYEDAPSDDIGDGGVVGGVCPGGDLQTCVDVCPGQFGAKVFGLCVATCSRRCP